MNRKGRLMAAVACVGWTPAVVCAAPPQTAGQAPATDPAAADDIVVTASKRPERLIDVPIAVTALRGEDLSRQNAVNFADYARAVPGLAFSDNGNGRPKPTIRGVNPNVGSGTVGIYIDEAPIPLAGSVPRLSSIDPRLFDVDRVEILRGPQGTLYGAGAMGGTIRIINNRPDSSKVAAMVRATGELTAGNAEGGALDAMVNLPLVTDALAVRATLYGRENEGYITRRAAGQDVATVPNQKTWGGRIALGYDRGGLRVEASIQHDSRSYNGNQDVTYGANNPTDALVQNFLFNVAEPNSDRFTLYNVTAEHALGPVQILSSTSFYDGYHKAAEETGQLQDYYFGASFPNAIFADDKVSSFTQEIRLSPHNRSGRLDWTIGGYFNNTLSRRSFSDVLPQYAALFGNALLYSGAFRVENSQRAVFGEATYHLVKTLSVTLGGRYYDVRGNSRFVADGLLNGGPSDDSGSSRATGFSGKANISWKPNPDALIFAQATQGFRPGFGIGPLPGRCSADAIARSISTNATQVGPDTVWNYEIGAKAAALQRRLHTAASVYRIDWSSIQLGVFLPCGFRQISNAGNARIQGVEGEATFALTNSVEVGGSASYTDSKFLSVTPGADASKGDPILEVPKWQAAAHFQYAFALWKNNTGFARIDVQHTGRSLLFYETTAATAPAPLGFRYRPAVTLLGARLQADFGKWSLALYGRNLLDERKVVGFAEPIAVNLAFRPRFAVNTPRTIGVELTSRF